MDVKNKDVDANSIREIIREEIRSLLSSRLDKIEKRLDNFEKKTEERFNDLDDKLYRMGREIKRLNWRVEDLEDEVTSLRRRVSGRGGSDERVPVIEPTPALGGIMGFKWDESGQSLD